MNKRIGTLKLQQIMGIGRVAMIGNSIADYIGTDIAVQLAVNDATQEYRDVAHYVSRAQLTSGVVEALSILVENNR
jgi:3-deoxy-D-manno-octulosonate 8-phosphate phosphatase KdsC-like HAD superfamily phosphatase